MNCLHFKRRTVATATRGFTLIEILVVTAIIALLSATMLGSLQEARLKAADATVRQEVLALRTLMEQERTNTGSYAAIKSGGVGTPGPWIASNGSCGTFTGQFASRAADICKKLVQAASTGSVCTSCVYFQTTTPNSNERYSIMAYLPHESRRAFLAGQNPYTSYICMGSSGVQTIAVNVAPWNEPGCQANP